MNYILFDGEFRNQLLPFTYTRPVADIRIGILTIREKWNQQLNTSCGTITDSYLQNKFAIQSGKENMLINAAYLPDENLLSAVKNLSLKEKLVQNNKVIAAGYDGVVQDAKSMQENMTLLSAVEYKGVLNAINHIWDIFQKNQSELEKDFEQITSGRTSAKVPASNQIIGSGKVFLEEGAKVECSIINTNNGSVYIGKDAEVMEGCLIRGPFALCNNSTLKMGAKIYGATTVGPQSKVGGEVNNSVIFGYSNKAHDGFLGNSVIGEWCNLGADCNNSNLKNNYSSVKVWSFEKNEYVDTGLQFCGLFMGDHSKASINTMFNTGTVVGVCSNIFGASFPPKYVPSFSWGGADGFESFDLKKAKDMAIRVMNRRDILFTKEDEAIFDQVSK
ncbi:MAG: GlmU family protein [Bacteroidia bacterium]|nr:GlmU family protein [Bacteroidia bacterium]NNC86637.1 glucose-1-phosphate thymidylyltransferase [Bacteroidia bacterium]